MAPKKSININNDNSVSFDKHRIHYFLSLSIIQLLHTFLAWLFFGRSKIAPEKSACGHKLIHVVSQYNKRKHLSTFWLLAVTADFAKYCFTYSYINPIPMV